MLKPSAESTTAQRGVTLKAVLIGLLLIPPNSYWVMNVEGIWHTGHPTCISLFWNVIFTLVCLILVNLLLRRLAPCLALTQGELITVYAMLCIASGLAGHDTMQLLIPALFIPYYFSDQRNLWDEVFGRYLPEWLTVRDTKAIEEMVRGGSTLYTREHILAWLGPVLWWTAFIAALALVMICLNVFMRREWTEREKLTYPIIRLPLALTEGGGTSRFFKSRALWIGIAGAMLLDIINGLAYLYPSVPMLNVRHDTRTLNPLFQTYPWKYFGWTTLPFYPFIIALGYFLPLDLSFSIWFFYWVKKLQLLVGGITGIRQIRGYPFCAEQSWGAWLAIALFSLWIARKHLKEVATTVIGPGVWRFLRTLLPEGKMRVWCEKLASSGRLDDSEEPMRYRTATLCFTLAMAFLVVFCLRMGFSLWVVLVIFVLFYLLSIAITKVRAELGPPAHEMAFMMNTAGFLQATVGAERVGAQNLALLPLFWFFSGRGYRQHIMPHQLEAFKMAERTGFSQRRLGFVMLASAVVGSFCAFWAYLHLSYQLGSGPGDAIAHSRGQFWIMGRMIQRPEDWGPTPEKTGALLGGFAFTFALMLIRGVIPGFPLHPAGYALSMNFGVDYFWSCLVISCAVKWFVQRFAGRRGHRIATMFFFGVILGEYFMGSFWSVYSVIFRLRTYDFAPG